ncbi:MAG TPA: ribosomal protein S18-alanine N-acetyltransferase [Anaerolineales bacterium]|nr:ribosomal protein S18-alanine N-acetyltransferase [Anaerolineales bacterium]HNA89717.1 ribosomal protein S18-alanine N-acetyltransferase [Anaerolineales bacterium]HNB36671.1 ribosomal protein S18-alanine N-acetyltransferase [Anaerolineales bacterium]HNC08644.1 ribosomal protein S18-alanine N-acetyltransferase [Anaerolineales bacterium]
MNLVPPNPHTDLSGLYIRKMTEDDLDQVVVIDQVSFSLPWPARSFRFEVMDNESSRCWVAVIDKQIVAMIVSWLLVDELHVATIATHPDFRERGIGKRLLVHALLAAKAEGATSSILEVRASNQAALKMYHGFGYVEDGRRKEYYKDNNEDAILMSLNGLDHLSGE